MSDYDLYAGREQTLIKHAILREYLKRFARIVGSRWSSITYVDSFAGPWNARSEELKDSSFAIALDELREARATLQKNGRDVRLRAFFLEKDGGAYAKLKTFTDSVTDVEIETRNCEFEAAVPDILRFVRKGVKTFTFVFVDPTGWTGFGLNAITPLLKLKPSEVLINFMTGHVKRFLESPDEQTHESFVELFGDSAFKETVAGLKQQEREDAIVWAYMNAVGKRGPFDYVCSAIVLHPQKDRTHFHLIYATRDLAGVEVFKEAEKKAMAAMEKARAGAQKRARELTSGQLEFGFLDDDDEKSKYYGTLRERYLDLSRNAVLDELKRRGRIPYDEAWTSASQRSLVWESDLKDWVREWRKDGSVVGAIVKSCGRGGAVWG